MNTTTMPKWAVTAAAMAVMPTITCFAYYSVTGSNRVDSVWAVLVTLAYPATIIGAIGLVNTYVTRQPSNKIRLMWMACIAVPAAFLVWVRS